MLGPASLLTSKPCSIPTEQALNLVTVAQTTIQNVEVINLTGSGDDMLSLLEVLDLSFATSTLRVDGNAGDGRLQADSWLRSRER